MKNFLFLSAMILFSGNAVMAQATTPCSKCIIDNKTEIDNVMSSCLADNANSKMDIQDVMADCETQVKVVLRKKCGDVCKNW